jgi:hypothetical protein
MRDVGILIWVALLIVGVVGSMVRQIRGRTSQQPRRVPDQPRPAQPAHWAQRTPAPVVPPPAQPRPPRPPPRPTPAPAERLSRHEASAHPEPQAGRKPLFAGKNEIVRAVIASEVLGKPRALNDEYFGR